MRIKSFILALILGCMSVFATISTARADEAFLTYTPSSGSISFSSSTSNGREANVKFKWNIAGCSEFNASNDTIDRADSSQVNRWFSGVISRHEDVDFIKIRLTGRRLIRFISPDGNQIDYDIKIYDDHGRYTGCCLASTSPEQAQYFNFKYGSYYIKVYSYGSGTSSLLPYYLIVT